MRPRDRVAVALALALVTVPLFPAQPASAQSLYCERKVTFRTIGFGWFHRLLPEVTTRCTGAVAISMSWPGPVAPGGLSTARARLTVRWAGEFVQPLVGRFVRFLLSGAIWATGVTNASGWATAAGTVHASPGIKPTRAECMNCSTSSTGSWVPQTAFPVATGVLQVIPAGIPAVPIPRATFLGGGVVELTWAPVAGAVRYYYRLSLYRYYGTDRLTKARYQLPRGTYTFEVQAVNAVGQASDYGRVAFYMPGIPTTISSWTWSPSPAYVGQWVSTRATLTGSAPAFPGSPVTTTYTLGYPLTFALGGLSSYGSSARFVPSAAGTLPTTVSFAGSGYYEPTQRSGTLVVLPAAPTIAASSWSSPVRQGQSMTASVRLTGGAPGQSAYFYVGGRYLGSRPVDASGTASVTAPISLAPGSYDALTAVYYWVSGHGQYVSAQGRVTVLPNRPAAPTNVSVTPASSATNSFTASWAPVSGARYYRYYIDGALRGVLNAQLNPTSVRLSAWSLGTHRFQVAAVDAAGNASDPSQPALFTWEQSATSLAMAFGNTSPSRSAPVPAALTMDTARCVGRYVQGSVKVNVLLTDASGTGIAGRSVTLSGPGWTMWSPATDASGRTSQVVPFRDRVGRQPVTVTFRGDKSYRRSVVTSLVLIPDVCAQPSPTPTPSPTATPTPTPTPTPTATPSATPSPTASPAPAPTQPPYSVDVPPR